MARQALDPPTSLHQNKRRVESSSPDHAAFTTDSKYSSIEKPISTGHIKASSTAQRCGYVAPSSNNDFEDIGQTRQSSSKRRCDASDGDMPPPPKRQRRIYDLAGPRISKKRQASKLSKSTAVISVNPKMNLKPPQASEREVNDNSLKPAGRKMRAQSMSKNITTNSSEIQNATYSDGALNPPTHRHLQNPTISRHSQKPNDRTKDFQNSTQNKENTPSRHPSYKTLPASSADPSKYRLSPYPSLRNLNRDVMQKPNIHSHHLHQDIGPRPTEYVSRAVPTSTTELNQIRRKQRSSSLRTSAQDQKPKSSDQHTAPPFPTRIPTAKTLRRQLSALSSNLTPETVFTVRFLPSVSPNIISFP